MIVIIGAGLTGLFIASRKYQNSIIIEEQPSVGGLYSIEEISEVQIPSLPPLLFNECELPEDFETEELELKYISKKYEFINKKICEKCKDIPNYLKIKNKVIFLKNMNLLIRKYVKNVKILNGYPVKLGKNFIITNHSQLIKFDKLINTGSLRKILNLLNIPLNLNSVPVYVFILLTLPQPQNEEWDVYIDGDLSVSFSHIFKFKLYEKKLELYYIYSFLKNIKQSIDLKKIIIDIRKKGIIRNESEILAFRTKLIRDGLLILDSEQKMPKIEVNGIYNCGRLGKWTNIDLCGVLQEVHEC